MLVTQIDQYIYFFSAGPRRERGIGRSRGSPKKEKGKGKRDVQNCEERSRKGKINASCKTKIHNTVAYG